MDSIELDFGGFQKLREPDLSLADSIELDSDGFQKPREADLS